jgi:hypothetical protein
MFTEARTRISIIFIVLVILFSYQNCAPVRFSQSSAGSAGSIDNSNGYGNNSSGASSSGGGSSSGTNGTTATSTNNSGNTANNNQNPFIPTITNTPSAAILSTRLESTALYFERPATQDFTLTSLARSNSNLSFAYHSGFSYALSFSGIADALASSCMRDANCSTQEYLSFWNYLNTDDIMQFLITDNMYNNQSTYQLNCSDVYEAYLCAALSQAARVKQAQGGICQRRSVPITTAMRNELEVRYDHSYTSIYSNLIIDQDCLCYYAGSFSVDTMGSNQVFHIKSPALDSHCRTNFSEYH